MTKNNEAKKSVHDSTHIHSEHGEGNSANSTAAGKHSQMHMHQHVLADGTVITHSHGDEHHDHDHAYAVGHHHDGHEQLHDADHHNDGHDAGHDHEHGPGHHHGHVHSHAHTKAVLNRMSRAIGHLESVKRMVEDGRDCSEVLIQLSAVTAALQGTGKLILKDHIEHCIVDAVQANDHEAIESLNKAIDQFVR